MSLNSNALISLSYIDTLDIAQIGTTSIEDLVNAASQYLINQTHRDLISTSYTEYAEPFNETARLVLEQFPIIAIGTITYNDATLVENTDYLVDYDTGIIYRLNGDTWYTSYYDGLKIEYSAGWSLEDMPSDIQQACRQIVVAYYYQQSGREDQSAPILESMIVTNTINKYKRREY